MLYYHAEPFVSMGILLFCIICHIKRTETTSVFGISLAGTCPDRVSFEISGCGIRGAGRWRPSAADFIFCLRSSLGIHGCFGELYREGSFVRAMSFSAQAGDIGKASSSVLCPFLLRQAVTGRILRPCCILFYSDGR